MPNHRDPHHRYDIHQAQRDPKTNRVIFVGTPSEDWGHLMGQPNPGRPWGRQGDTRPVQYVATDEVAHGTATVERKDHARRAVIGDYVLTVSDDGQAVLVMPSGSTVTVVTQ